MILEGGSLSDAAENSGGLRVVFDDVHFLLTIGQALIPGNGRLARDEPVCPVPLDAGGILFLGLLKHAPMDLT